MQETNQGRPHTGEAEKREQDAGVSNSSRVSENPKNQDTQDNSDNQNFQGNQYFPDYEKPPVEELVFQWQAPSRPFKKRKRQYFTTITTIVLLLCLILFFAGQILPVAVVVAVAFMNYILATIPPQTITNSITTFGIHNENDFYSWDEFGRFWFDKKHDEEVLYIEVSRFPFRLSLLVGTADKEELTEILSEILINQKPPLTETEKLSKWLQEKIPIDLDS